MASYFFFFLSSFNSLEGSSFLPTNAIPTSAYFNAPTSFVPSPHINI